MSIDAVKTRSYEEILAALVAVGISESKVSMVDGEFSLPATDWITGTFSEAFDSFLDAAGLKYDAETWDCDNFARLAAVYAQLLHARTRPGEESALAFGEFAYQTGAGGHDICVAVVNQADALAVLFFEPQPSQMLQGYSSGSFKQVTLSKQEITSCLFCRF